MMRWLLDQAGLVHSLWNIVGEARHWLMWSIDCVSTVLTRSMLQGDLLAGVESDWWYQVI